MAFDRNLAMQQLIQIYRQAYQDILERIATKEVTGGTADFKKALLVDIDKKLKELDATTDKWKDEVIPTAYEQAQKETLSYFEENNIRHAVNSSFAKTHTEAINVLQQNFYDNMSTALNFVGRRLDDEIRKAHLTATTEKISTGQTIKQMKNNLITKLADRGVTAYKDSAGRTWTLDSYAQMSARTVTAEATNKGTFNQLRSMDRDLVKLSSHASPCPICSPLEGRIYSLSGDSDRFPSIENALPNEYGIIHPNCIHRFFPYVLELADNVERDIKRSNKSFDIDPRTKKAKEVYKRNQKLNRYRRKEEKLTYKLKGLEEGTEKYERNKKSLERTISKRRDLERKKTTEDAELIDGIWRIQGGRV